MNTVVGLDISKGKSQVQAFLDKKSALQRSFKVAHTLEGINKNVVFFNIVCKSYSIKWPLNVKMSAILHTGKRPFLVQLLLYKSTVCYRI